MGRFFDNKRWLVLFSTLFFLMFSMSACSTQKHYPVSIVTHPLSVVPLSTSPASKPTSKPVVKPSVSKPVFVAGPHLPGSFPSTPFTKLVSTPVLGSSTSTTSWTVSVSFLLAHDPTVFYKSALTKSFWTLVSSKKQKDGDLQSVFVKGKAQFTLNVFASSNLGPYAILNYIKQD